MADDDGRQVPWLEVAIAINALVLVFLLFPAAWYWLVGALDVRQWSRLTWFIANLIVVIVLLAIRYWPRKRAED
jgi:hypothetical protein